jgi:hypothetical protein
MSTGTKIAAMALAAVTVASTVAAGTSEAEARRWGWGGVGLGLAAGAMIGAGIASSAYAEPSYVYVGGPRCRWVRQYDGYGYYVGRARVCGY